MADIFISYAREDLDRVEPLAAALRYYGDLGLRDLNLGFRLARGPDRSGR